MNLEIGMFVRTKTINTHPSFISKIVEIKNERMINGEIGKWIVFENKIEGYFEFVIIKASHNIIDLIEVGDYVNGKKVIKKGKYTNDYPKFMVGTYYIELENENKWLNSNKNIISIVTKEQFSSMEYKLEE